MDTATKHGANPTELMDIPEEIRGMIWKNLRLKDILNVRLTSSVLKCDADNYCNYSMTITGNCVGKEHKNFIQNVNLRWIRFMRVSKQFYEEDCFRSPDVESDEIYSLLKYRGRSHIHTIGKVQILSLYTNQSIVYNSKYGNYHIRHDFFMLREFLLNVKGDVFQACLLG